MPKFKIEVEEILQRIIEVEAESEEEAFDLVEEQYNKAEIVLTENDFILYEIRPFSND